MTLTSRLRTCTEGSLARALIALLAVLLLGWLVVSIGDRADPLASDGEMGPSSLPTAAIAQVAEGQAHSSRQHEPGRVVLAAGAEFPRPDAEKKAIPDEYVPGSMPMRHFTLPSGFIEADAYVAAKGFNARGVRLEDRSRSALDTLVLELNEVQSTLNQAALLEFNRACAWKIEQGDTVPTTALTDAGGDVWRGTMTKSTGEQYTVEVRPGEYRLLDAACFESQRFFLEGERQILEFLTRADLPR